MRELADLARDLVKALFDPYRPELHYMRGPGPKWHAKHAQPFRLGSDVVALPAMVPAAKRSIRPRHLVVHAASLAPSTASLPRSAAGNGPLGRGHMQDALTLSKFSADHAD